MSAGVVPFSPLPTVEVGERSDRADQALGCAVRHGPDLTRPSVRRLIAEAEMWAAAWTQRYAAEYRPVEQYYGRRIDALDAQAQTS